MAKKKRKKKQSQIKKKHPLEIIALVVTIIHSLATMICVIYETFFK